MNIEKIMKPITKAIAQLERGIAENDNTLAANQVRIGELTETNVSLVAESARAGKIRDNMKALLGE